MELLITISLYYAIGFIALIIINAFMAGYKDSNFTYHELIESLLWPVTIVILSGTISKIVVQKIIKGV